MASDIVTTRTDCPFRFTDLPPELRNRIYDLALFHSDNHGIVAASPAIPGVQTTVYFDGKWQKAVLIRNDGNRKQLDHLLEYTMDPMAVLKHLNPSPDPDAEGFACHELYPTHLPNDGEEHFFYLDSSNSLQVVDGHVCGLKCLRQPTLTLTNSQIRSECLGLFYESNEFDLNFSSLGHQDLWTRLQKLLPVIKWWRSTGDTHLRRIPTFRLTAEEPGEASLTFTLELQPRGVTPSIKMEVGPDKLTPEVSMEKDVIDRETSGKLLEVGRLAAQGQLCVMVIECALTRLDWTWTRVLDRMGGFGAIVDGRSNEADAKAEWWAEKFEFW